MNLNFNVNLGKTAAPTSLPGAAPAAKPAAAQATPGLTITQATASPEDVSAASIPDSALTRDDDLGLLISSAFTLPAPPMPNFPTP